MQDSGGQRDSYPVVRECEQQVLPDIPQGELAQAPSAHDAAQVALHQRDLRALHGDVGPRSHRDGHIGAGQSG